ncbi:MAG: hypothetical protein ACQGVC_13460 [Myxococcota bacterium]
MTIALCLHCGEIKRGGVFPECRACGQEQRRLGKVVLLLSDHYLEVDTLEELSTAFKEIRSRAPDAETTELAFMTLLSRSCEGVDIVAAPDAPPVDDLLSGISLGPVVFRPKSLSRGGKRTDHRVQPAEASSKAFYGLLAVVLGGVFAIWALAVAFRG